MSFVERNGLWSDDQRRAAGDIARRIEADGLEVVRFSFPDQHGILRGKTLTAEAAKQALTGGVNVTSTLLGKDTSHRAVFPAFTVGGGFGMPEMQGGADMTMVADPQTFRVLPWARKTGWVLCDLYFASGRPVPFATRQLYRDALGTLGARGYDHVVGVEVEFYVFKLEDPKLAPQHAGQPGTPPDVSLLTHGYSYLTEQRFDQIEPVLELLRRDLLALGLPLRSLEIEYGPSQCEFTFAPQVGLAAADLMVLFRSATKQICRRHGYHATFMSRPRIPNVTAAGWHLHQSLCARQGEANVFVSDRPEALLSEVGMHFLGGLLAHARPASVFSTPTINGYKRYAAYSLAPDRAVWGHDNRGVMLRVLGAPHDAATRIENRVGEPAANPYLYMASQLAAGLDGIDQRRDPGPSADTPYETEAEFLPKSLQEAVAALRADEFFADAFGRNFIDYYLAIKDAEISRFQQEISEWEQREYFELF